MTMLKSILVDDEQDSLESLSYLLGKCCDTVEIMAECRDGGAGVAAIKEHTPDIVFLDIQMPGMSGFQMIEQLEPPAPYIIFTTAYDQYAIDAIKVSAMDYLLKPIDEDELIAAVQKAALRLEQSDPTRQLEVLITNIKGMDLGFQKLAIPSVEDLKFINISEILYCRADGNYTIVYTVDGGSHTISKPLKEITDILSQPLFFRTHQSFLVNLNYITRYVRGSGGQVILQDGTAIQVARTRKEDLLKKIYK